MKIVLCGITKTIFMSRFKTIDYTSATHKLNEILFDVSAVNLITTDAFNKDLSNLNVDNYVAIVNENNKQILSVVSKKYHLFTNKQALELGKQAFVQLFPSCKIEELIPFKVIAPSTKTFCHIDLIHKDVNFNAWEQETWLPFVRITNSYNRTFSLAFELGFVRKLCSNGVIFDKQTIKVKFNHTKGSIPVSIVSDVSKLKKLENEFKEHLLNLKRFHINRKMSFAIICKALNLDWKDHDGDDKQHAYINFKTKALELTNVYMDIDGECAFAVMNVMTDLVSHQDDYKNIPLFNMRANQYYNRISTWMVDYCKEAEKRDFKVDAYLGQFIKFSES